MKRLVFALLLLGGCLISGAVCQDKSTAKRPEATPNLSSTLQALKNRGASRATLSRQLADAILLLAETDTSRRAPPSRVSPMNSLPRCSAGI
ncbi:MAG: hypothetical protein ABSE21_18535 [Bryobacteraceae bacterium]|jgi:hypothetical protein